MKKIRLSAIRMKLIELIPSSYFYYFKSGVIKFPKKLLLMTKLFIIIMMACTFVCISSCKKDYPKDIPDWLKDEIKKMIKEKPCNELPVNILEYSNDNTEIYCFTKSCPACSDDFYDINGTKICSFEFGLWGTNDSCGTFLLGEFQYTRKIWSEKYCE